MTTVLVNHVELARIEHYRPKLERLPRLIPPMGRLGFISGQGLSLHYMREEILCCSTMS